LKTGNWTYPTSQALLWEPLSYTKKGTRTYPLIINLYGQKQCGSTDLTLLIDGNTMSNRIAGGFDVTAVNPVDGQKYSFFVFSPQCPTKWGWSAPQVYKMLTQLKQMYPIDTTRIYLTGFSAGGWGLWTCMTDNDDLTKQFAAVVPISAASADRPSKLTNIAKYRIACLDICGNQDAFYTNNVNYVKIINSSNPSTPAQLNTLYNVWHNAWKYAYDSAWKTEDNINIYEWMLQYKRQ
jgi:predicted peptidase